MTAVTRPRLGTIAFLAGVGAGCAHGDPSPPPRGPEAAALSPDAATPSRADPDAAPVPPAPVPVPLDAASTPPDAAVAPQPHPGAVGSPLDDIGPVELVRT